MIEEPDLEPESQPEAPEDTDDEEHIVRGED
jgi:hypothetical protein